MCGVRSNPQGEKRVFIGDFVTSIAACSGSVFLNGALHPLN